MVNWQFWKRRTPARILRLRPRGELSDAVRVEFPELAPDVRTYLGQAAYLQLGYFETLTRLIRATPDLAEKEALSLAAGAALRKHLALLAEIREEDADPAELMEPFREPLDAFRRATVGARPRETMLTVHITAGLLDDFYLALASGYGERGRRVARILRADNDRRQLAELLTETIRGDEEWRALLSLWARRLVGDTLLVARGALLLDGDGRGEAARAVEPVFTALMAAHARRMDALGLAS
ncbi:MULTISPECIES: ferritin-like fold-containing protein [Microbacterium]|uniref:Ferritin-like domain-containing protein n=1 Tax=Microbacterium gilvum TaxID=1336204 RepID=A0ABP8ZWC9_9MICO